MGGGWGLSEKIVFAVYHRPGDPRGHEIMHSHVNRLSEFVGLEVRPTTLDEFIQMDKAPDNLIGVLAYLLFRGGHYYDLSLKARELGTILIAKIPTRIIAEGLCKALKGSVCDEVALVYHRSRRFSDVQAYDILRVTEIVMDLCGFRMKPVAKEYYTSHEDCVVYASLLPGRRLTGGRDVDVKVPYLIPYIGDDIIIYMGQVLRNLIRKQR